MKKIKKKSSFISMYKMPLLYFGLFILFSTAIPIIIKYWDHIVVLCSSCIVSLYFSLPKNIRHILYFVPLLIFLVIYFFQLFRYLWKHTYLPLTKEELDANKIYTVDEYIAFLNHFFGKYKPLPSAIEKITESAKSELGAISYDCELIENKLCADYFFERCAGRTIFCFGSIPFLLYGMILSPENLTGSYVLLFGLLVIVSVLIGAINTGQRL